MSTLKAAIKFYYLGENAYFFSFLHCLLYAIFSFMESLYMREL